jgi:hypothetical protein
MTTDERDDLLESLLAAKDVSDPPAEEEHAEDLDSEDFATCSG